MNIHHQHHRKDSRPIRRGATLIDVALGSMLMASLLIPSLHLISQSQQNTQRLAIRQALLQTAEQEIETLQVRLSEPSRFATTLVRPIIETRTIRTSLEIPARIRVQAIADRSVQPARLLTLSVEAWYDKDRDNRLDPDEIVTPLRTQVAAPK